IQFSVSDILHNRSRKQMGILQHHTQGPSQILLFDLVDVDIVVTDLSIRNVIKAVDQVGNGSLAGSGGSYESDFLARLCPQTDIVQHDLILRVTEVHIVKDHLTLLLLISDGA